MKACENRRGVADANWLRLCGAVGDEEDEVFAIGIEHEYRASANADLYLLASDLRSRYGNNDRFLDVAITRDQ